MSVGGKVPNLSVLLLCEGKTHFVNRPEQACFLFDPIRKWKYYDENVLTDSSSVHLLKGSMEQGSWYVYLAPLNDV